MVFLCLLTEMLRWLEWDVTLLESMNKRCVFLEHAVGVTGLSNIQIVRGRAEVKLCNSLSSFLPSIPEYNWPNKLRNIKISSEYPFFFKKKKKLISSLLCPLGILLNICIS